MTRTEDQVTKQKCLSNWKQVKAYALEAGKRLRPEMGKRWNRVSKASVHPQVEAVIKTWLDNYISSLPSKGKTIK